MGGVIGVAFLLPASPYQYETQWRKTRHLIDQDGGEEE